LPNEVLEIYDVITPNGDGYNDTWTIKFLQNIDVYTVRIFARNGVLLYENQSNYNNDWNGDDLPDGAYFYTIETAGRVYKGGLTIIK
jgi:gliding motility-associated-like protein